MGDGAVAHRYLDELAPRDAGALADRLRHLVGLAQACADAPLAVADNDDGAEVETATTLHHLRDAVDKDHLLGELGLFTFALSSRPS